jgi:Domain of unknown function (DUF4293)
MIQRSQTLWLLLAAACAFLTFKFPFYNLTSTVVGQSNEFTAQSKILLTILTSILGALCLFLVFLYKNRKLQVRLSFAALLLSLLDIYLYFYYRDASVSGVSLFSIFTFMIPLFILMAIRGIYRDIRLIKSLDRIR